jgi:hypothetical protein
LAERPRQAGRPAPRSASTRSHFPALSLTMSYKWAPTFSYFPFHGISPVRSLFAETYAIFLSMFIFLNCLPTTHAPTTPLLRQNHLAPHLALAQLPRARARRHLPADARHVRLRSASSVARSRRLTCIRRRPDVSVPHPSSRASYLGGALKQIRRVLARLVVASASGSRPLSTVVLPR